MKVLLCFVAVFALASAISKDEAEEAQARETQLADMLVECTAETNLDPKEAHELLLGNLENDSREAKCFVRCLFKKEGFLNDKDEPQVKFIVESLMISANVADRSHLHYLISKCTRKNKKVDMCDRAFWLLECYINNKAVLKNKDEL